MTERNISSAAINGLKCRCPSCGKTSLFNGFLKVKPECEVCGEDLSHHQADDLPAYLSIFLVGHIVVPLLLYVQLNYSLAMWQQMVLWPLLSMILALLFLPPLKGLVVGVQWAAKMHGFGQVTLKPPST